MTTIMIRDLIVFALGVSAGVPLAYLMLRVKFRRCRRRYYV